MVCPDCGHDNLGGEDTCDHCGQDLSSIDIPTAGTGLQRTIMETPVRDLVPPPALTVSPREPVARVVRLMREGKQGSVLVMEGNELAGIFTERDALLRLTGKPHDLEAMPVAQVMTRDPKTLREEDTLAYAMHCMAVGNYRHIPVLGPGKPPRFISVRGVLRFLDEHAR
jgi:CBS domain-containing protein